MQKDGIGEKKRNWAKIEEVKSLRTKLHRANRWFGHFMTIGEFEYSIEYIEKPKERKRVKIDLKMPPRILGTNCIFVKRHGQRSWHTSKSKSTIWHGCGALYCTATQASFGMNNFVSCLDSNSIMSVIVFSI